MNLLNEINQWLHGQYLNLAFTYYLITSFICFTLYARDKWLAVRGQKQKSPVQARKTKPAPQTSSPPRISEQKLLIWTFLCGGLVALLAQQFFRHKTKKPLFEITAMVACVVHAGAWLYFKIAN